MISQILAGVEQKLGALLDMAVDATFEDGTLKTVFISTDHDPQVGIFGGPVFTLWWKLKPSLGYMEKKRWPDRREEGYPMDVNIVQEDWLVPKEEWTDEFQEIWKNRKIVYNALIAWDMRPY